MTIFHPRSSSSKSNRWVGKEGFITGRGIGRFQSNLTHHQGPMMALPCPVCFETFIRPPSHVRRVDTAYCSRECASEGWRIKARVTKKCASCGKDFSTSRSRAAMVKTCSRECSSLLRRRGEKIENPLQGKEYKRAVSPILERGVCETCGSRSGPWRVCGLIITQDEVLPIYDNSLARLLCLNCHMNEIWPLGHKARKEKLGY